MSILCLAEIRPKKSFLRQDCMLASPRFGSHCSRLDALWRLGGSAQSSFQW